MVTLTLHAHGPLDPARVWERYADPTKWATWAPQIQRVTTDGDRLAAGMTGTVHAGVLPWPTLPVRFEVLDVDEPAREWSWRAHVGPVAMRLAHGVTTALRGSGTWLRVDAPAPLVAAYAPVARIALHRLVRE